MPQKYNSAGKLQNYVPKGNGDASGEYSDNQSGSNKHWKNPFYNTLKNPSGQAPKTTPSAQTTTSQANTSATPKTSTQPKIKAQTQAQAQPQQTQTQAQAPTQAKTTSSIPKVDTQYITKKDAKAIGTYDRNQCITILQGFSSQFDTDKLNDLSDADLQQLVIAWQSQEKIEKLKAKAIDTARKEAQHSLKTIADSMNIYVYSGYFKPNTIHSFADIKNKIDALTQQWTTWYQANPNQWNQERMQMWTQVKQDWENRIGPQYDSLIQQLEKTYADNSQLIKDYKRTYNPNINTANNDNYSQEAKDDAIWFTPVTEGQNYLSRANNFFKKYYNAMVKNTTYDERQSLADYTNAFSRINNPLRNRNYTGVLGKSGGVDFEKDVKNMTSAIDKSQITDNVWLERGVNSVNMGGTIGKIDGSRQLTQSELANLIGQCYEDQGFSSHTIAKSGTKGSYNTTGQRGGFTNKPIIFNTYCPIGTKGAYLEPLSKNPNQYEMLLQRGYSYRITKAYYSGGTLYIDQEVILGSDDNKYDDATLSQLKNKYF